MPLTEADLQQPLTPMLERLLRIWECVEVERFVPSTRGSVGRPPRDRAALALVFVAKPAKSTPVAKPPARKRGRLHRYEVREPKTTRLQRQALGMSLEAMLADLPQRCDIGSKRNSQGFTSSWVGYKLHLDVADGMIPISAVLTSASVHDS